MNIKEKIDHEINSILSGTQDVIGLEELKNKLAQKKRLCVKLGADPTAPNLHLGHIVVLEKLRDFQELGHRVVFLIGDFTAQIGDPTGKTKTRPPLDIAQIKKNVETYVAQVGKILDISRLEIVYNSLWFNIFSSQDWLELLSKVTVAQITEREDFKNRLALNIPIRLHELLYPLMQAYDSVKLNADVEIGGTDQTFNLLLGRTLQDSLQKNKQVIMTMPLIEGTDGKLKMSKSLQNDIGMMEEPKSVFGKLMSISDELMYKYFKILLRYEDLTIDNMKKRSPIENKKDLAFSILKKYWSKKEAEESLLYFSEIIQKRNFSEVELDIIELDKAKSYSIFDIFQLINKSESRSNIRRLLSDGAISFNNKKITSEKHLFVEDKTLNSSILKIGKYKLYNLRFS